MAKKAKSRSASTTGSNQSPERGVKSNAIRDYLATHKDAKPKQVVEALQANGITVSPNMVSILKAKGKVKSAKRQAKQAVADKDVTAGAQSSKSAGLDAALLLYKAARGQDVPQSKVTSAFLSLVELLS